MNIIQDIFSTNDKYTWDSEFVIKLSKKIIVLKLAYLQSFQF